MSTQSHDKAAMAPVPWSSNQHSLVWRLIGLVEEPENHKVLVGKGKNEVSSIILLYIHIWTDIIHTEFWWGEQGKGLQVHC
jgi:hypothetical protein